MDMNIDMNKVLAAYQQHLSDMQLQNIVKDVLIEQLNEEIVELKNELEKLKQE